MHNMGYVLSFMLSSGRVVDEYEARVCNKNVNTWFKEKTTVSVVAMFSRSRTFCFKNLLYCMATG